MIIRNSAIYYFLLITIMLLFQINVQGKALIKVDAGDAIGPMQKFWRSTGFSPGNLLLNADMRQAMAYAGSIPHEGMVFVRVHYLLELIRAQGLGTEDPEYDWTALDNAIHVLISNRLKPFFELMGNPEGYFDNYEEGVQVRAWKRLVRDLANQYIEKYGKKEVRSWYFETWNEPDISFWKQSNEAFMNYYDACSEGLKEADNELRFGGPGSAQVLSDRFKNLLKHCDSGQNFFTGETGVRIDFISVHVKGGPSRDEDVTPDSKSIINREKKIINYIRENHPKFADLPFINNECDPQVGWSRHHGWRHLPYYPALAIKIINQHMIQFIDQMNVNYAVLSNDNGFLGTWAQRTLLARFGQLEKVDIGQAALRDNLIRFQEDPKRTKFEQIKKPILNGMEALALLGKKRLAVSGCEDIYADVGCMATIHNQSQIAVLVYNSKDKINTSGIKTIILKIENIPFNSGRMIHYRIDEDHTNPFRLWDNWRAPKNPDFNHFKQLRKAQELEMLNEPEDVKITNGKWELIFELPIPGISVILLSRKPDHKPEKVTGLTYELYEGLTEEKEIMIKWKPVDSRFIQTYEILYRRTEKDQFKRINEKDLFCSAWLYTAPSIKGYYQVRAVDYWDRTGKASNILVVE